MGKALIEVGAVIAGVALIATGIGAAAGAGLLGAEAAAVAGSAGTLTLFGVSTTTLLEVGAAVATVGELMIKPKLTGAGSAQQFKADTNAPIPCVAGRFGVGGNVIYETTSGGSNKAKAGAAGNEYLTQCVILSGLGPIKAWETLKFNDTILNWNGEQCTGGYIPSATIGAYNVPYKNNNNGTYENDQYNDHAWHNVQLGAVPTPYFAYPSKLNTESDAPLPEWDKTHGLSGFAADFLTIVYDQTVYTGGMPKPLWTLSGYGVYDPRQDATYPGGAANGAQRWLGQGASATALLAARASWSWSQNPYIHALNYALGFFLPDGATQLGSLYAGGGVPWRGVDVDQFIACANIADANGWTIGMQWTTDDDPWSVLTTMLQAGGGQPIDRDGRIGCIINAPLTSLGTITNDDLQGSVSVDTTTALRDKLNRVYPRFHSEPHDWAMVPVVAPITGASYLAEDGRVIAKQLDYEGVTQVNQACQLAAYDLANSREGIVATLPCKLTAANYRVGDCITVDVDVANLTNLKMVVIKRSPDFQTGAITLTCRSETDAKHPFAMGVSGVAPPTPTITGVDPSYVGAPLPDFWATGLLEQVDAATGESRSMISVIGSAGDNVYASSVMLRWRAVTQVDGVWTPTGGGTWSYRSFPASQGNYQLDLNPGSYDVQIAYLTIQGAGPSDDTAWLDLGVETVSGSTAANAAAVGDLTAKQINDLLDDKGESSAAIDANVYKMLGQITDPNTGLPAIGTAVQAAEAATAAVAAAAADADSGAIAVLSGIVDAANERASRIFGATLSDGTPVRTVTADSAEAISLLGSVEGGLFVLSDDTLTLKDGTKVATSLREVVAAVDGTPTQPGLQAQITDLAQATTDTTNQTSIASKLEQVTATVDGADGTPALQAQITDLTQATTDETNPSSIASKLEQVTATVNGSGGTPSLQAQVTDLASATTDLTNGSSIASKLEAVTSTVDGADGAPSLAAQILDLKTATTDTSNGSSIASQLEAVEATVNGQGSTPSLSAQIATLKEATTDASNGSSLASLLETVTATVGTPPASDGSGGSGVQAQVYQAAQAAANANGKLAARLVQGVQAGTGAATVTIESDGVSGLIKLVADAITLGNTSDGSEIDVLAVIGDAAHFASPVYVGDGLRIDPAIPGLVAVNGSSQAIFGEGFGSAGNMILWTGPSSVSASQASRSNCYLCIDANGLYIPPSANTAVSSGGNAASASAGASWTDISSAPFTLAAQGYWLNPDGATDGYAASKPGAPANYASSGQTATGDLQIVERTSGQPDIVLGSALGAITVTTDSEGSQITGSISLGRMTSTYTGSVELVLQARCTTTGRTLEGFPAGVGGTWTPKAS